MVRLLGADHVIDYTQQGFADTDKTYDVIMDTAGTAPFSKCKHLLKEKGRLLVVLGGLSDMLKAPWVSMTSSKRIIAGPAAELPEDLRHLARLAEEGHFKPVIDRRYRLEQIVDAHRYVDSGRKKGNVVVIWE